MKLPDSLRQSVRLAPRDHYRGGHWTHEDAEIVREEAVTLFVNGREFVTMVVTPTDLKELAIGFLASEGFIQTAAEVTIFQHQPDSQQIWVRVPGLSADRLAGSGKRYLSSCCGRGRPAFYFVEDANLEPIEVCPLSYPLTASRITRLFASLGRWTRQQHSGGLHVAGLAGDAGILAMRTDVGRHNALDKLYGFSLLQGMALQDKVVVFSGRLSSEVILKIGRMGVPVVISNAAPTTLGIELADTLGITAVGFARNSELSVYTHAGRLAIDPVPAIT